MLFTSLIASSLLVVASARRSTNKRHPSPCEKDLAGIVYQPKGYWCTYLEGISRELKDIAALYESTVGTSIIANFENRYGVAVQIVEPLGEVINYEDVNGVVQAQEEVKQYFTHNDAHSVLNLGSCDRNETAFHYDFLSFAADGKVVVVKVIRPLIEVQPTQLA